MKLNSKTNRGMTLFEILVVFAVVLALAVILLPPIVRRKARSSKISCANDLKQTGLGFKVWAGDNQDRFPMQVPVASGGTMELVESGTVWQHFGVMANELNTPKILLCPSDSERTQMLATVWGTNSYSGNNSAFTGNSNTSYFIGVDASDMTPTMPLAGDRNITLSNLALRAGLHALPTNAPSGWSDKIHVRKGNILLADGSVQGITSAQLPSYFHASGVPTNRLAVP